MAGALCRLVTSAFVISAVAVVTAGSSRGAADDGICTVVTQYVAGEGKRAVGGSTLTYCASDAECHRAADQVCCNGWRRDPDSKKLRCIKIDPSDSASVGDVALATNVGNDGDSTSIRRLSNVLKEEGDIQSSVRRPRGSAAESEKNPVVKTVQSEANPPDGQSVPNAEQPVQNAAATLAAKGHGKAESGVDPPADVDTSHTPTTGSQPVGPPSSGASGTHSQLNSSAPPPAGATPAAGAEKQASSSGTDTRREPSEGGSAAASGAASQPEGPPAVVMHTESKNSSHPDVESNTPARKEHNDDHGVSITTAGTAAPESSSAASISTRMEPQMPVPAPSKTVATAVQSQGDQTTSSTLSPGGVAPAIPTGQSGDNHPSVNKSVGSPSPMGQSGDNHPSVNKSVGSVSPTGQSGDNHPSVNKTEAPVSPTGQSGDNHPSVNKSVGSVSPMGQSGDNHPSVNKTEAPVSPMGQSGDNHPSVNKTEAHVSPSGQSGDNHPSVNKSVGSVSPTGQSGENHPSVNKTEAPVSTMGQSGDSHPSVNKRLASANPTEQSGDNHPSVNKTEAPASPTGQSGENHPSVNKSVAPASPSGQSGDNHPSVNNTAVSPPVSSNPNNSATVQGAEDSGTLMLTGSVLEHGRHVDTITSTDSSQSTATTPIPTIPNRTTTVNVPRPEATRASGAAATHPAQKETSHNSIHTGPSAAPATTGTTTTTASTQIIYHGSTTAARVAKPTDAPAAQHPNPETNNKTLEYVTVGNNGSGANAPAGKSSVPAGQQGGASAANTNGTSAINCTVAGHASNCTAANCSLLEHQRNCTDNNGTIPTVRLQTAPVEKPQGERPRAVPSGGSASKTASEVTISLLLVAAVAFVAALLYWRTRRRRRRYINCGTREPNLHFSNPVYDLESMMEQASLVKLQNAADLEDGGSNHSDHEGASQRQ